MTSDTVSKRIASFRDLRVWQEAYKLAIGIYKVSEKFPRHEQYGLTSQMRRAGVSVCSNIAEGFGRSGSKEKSQFYAMANGSLTELQNQIFIAHGVGYLSDSFENRFTQQCDTVSKMLYGLHKANSTKSGNR